MKKILIATDFSPHAERAMLHGLALARLFDCEIELLTSFSVSALLLGHDAFALPDGYIRQMEKNARRKLEKLVEPLLEEGLSASCTVAGEAPADAICQRARAGGSDLVVLGTHGRHGLSHVILGSVTERTARLAPCSALTAHAESPEPGPIRKILLATDFSDDAGAALAWAKSLTSRTGAALTLLHSVAPPFGIGEEETYVDDAATRARLAQAHERLEEIAGTIDCETAIRVGRRHPDTDVVEEAENGETDLIVVGTRGRRGLPHVLFGSTAERIIRRSQVPVVSVKQTQ